MYGRCSRPRVPWPWRTSRRRRATLGRVPDKRVAPGCFTRQILVEAPAHVYEPVTNVCKERSLTGVVEVVIAGQLRRHIRLGSEALYRVCSCRGGTVLVEVVRAPGLQPGHHFKLRAAAVAAMELVGAVQSAPSPADPPTVPSLSAA